MVPSTGYSTVTVLCIIGYYVCGYGRLLEFELLEYSSLKSTNFVFEVKYTRIYK